LNAASKSWNMKHRGAVDEESGRDRKNDFYEVYTWGDGSYGVLFHNGDRNDVEEPKRVRHFDEKFDICTLRLLSLQYGGISVIHDLEGRLYSWGKNDYSVLGLGFNGEYYGEPRLITALSKRKVADVCTSMHHTLFRTYAGELFGCGRNADSEALGRKTIDDFILTPEKVSIGNVKEMCAGTYSSAVVSTEGEILSFGSSYRGALGNGASKMLNCVAGPVAGALRREKRVLALCCRSLSLAALTVSEGTKTTVWTWGEGSFGSLGRGMDDTDDCLLPTAVEYFSNHNFFVESITSGFSAITAGKALYVWGVRNSGNFLHSPTLVVFDAAETLCMEVVCTASAILALVREREEKEEQWRGVLYSLLGEHREFALQPQERNEVSIICENDFDAEIERIGCGYNSFWCVFRHRFHLFDESVQNEKIEFMRELLVVL